MRFIGSKVFICALAALTTVIATSIPHDEAASVLPRDETAVDPCTLVDQPGVNASANLANWMMCQVNAFFPHPNNTSWDTHYTSTFHPSLLASFNSTPFSYTSLLTFYHSVNTTLSLAFSPFRHGFTSVVAVPNSNDKGGFVYMTGWEGGFSVAAKRELSWTDGAFAVVRDVKGRRWVSEWRESANIPNSAPVPRPVVWGCEFKKP
jgi:hypothetical protein